MSVCIVLIVVLIVFCFLFVVCCLLFVVCCSLLSAAPTVVGVSASVCPGSVGLSLASCALSPFLITLSGSGFDTVPGVNNALLSTGSVNSTSNGGAVTFNSTCYAATGGSSSVSGTSLICLIIPLSYGTGDPSSAVTVTYYNSGSEASSSTFTINFGTC